VALVVFGMARLAATNLRRYLQAIVQELRIDSAPKTAIREGRLYLVMKRSRLQRQTLRVRRAGGRRLFEPVSAQC
jgi:hypothetical protein